MHNPDEVLFVGVLHPEAALFESPFDIDTARHEHRDFIAALKREGIDHDFVDLLTSRWKYRIIPVSTDDQKAYAVNFLTLAKRKLIGVEGVSRAYKQALADAE